MSSTLKLVPARSDRLEPIEKVRPLNDDDLDCLRDLRDVLRRYGAQDRLGVALLHSHFDLKDGEIFLEVSDADGRTLTVAPARPEVAAEAVGTIWHLGDGEGRSIAACVQGCYYERSTGLPHNA